MKPNYPWEIIVGDCTEQLSAMEPGSARLVFVDPPYNQGVDYGRGGKADRLSDGEYLDWCRRWFAACVRVLADDGSLWVLLPYEWAGRVEVLQRDAGLHYRAQVIWVESFGVWRRQNFPRTHRVLSYFVKDKRRFVFNANTVMVESWRLRNNDKRAKPGGKIMPDVWDDIPRVCGNHPERIPELPTQLPCKLTDRIVRLASDPGDLVIDPMAGGGSMGLSARATRRRFVGVELNPAYAVIARRRLESRAVA